MRDLVSRILDAAATDAPETLVSELDFATSRQNQLLFFFKPECFLVGDAEKRRLIVEQALSLFETFGVRVAGALVLSGPRLAELEIMDRHYGFINTMSRRASQALDASDLDALRKLAGAAPGTAVLGGHEALARFPQFDAQSLDAFWATKKSLKLRSGLYTQAYEIEGTPVVLVNAFHPAQLAHFTGADRRLGLLLLDTDTPWPVLRRRMLGDTFPERAAVGSFRRTLHDDKARFGLADVSIANNCAHLSAGPFEAYFEVDNFLSRTAAVKFSLDQARMSAWLREAGVQSSGARALKNPVSARYGASLFDATEELDARSSAALFRLFFDE